MKKRFLSILLFFLLVFSFCFSGLAYADDSQPISWDDVSEDAISLRDSYYKLWSESSNFSEIFKNAADIPIKWLTFLADGSAALSPFNGLFYTKTETAYKVDYTGTKMGLKARFDNGDIKPDVPEISSDDFAEILEKYNGFYFPRNDYRKVSFRNDSSFQRIVNYSTYNSSMDYSPTLRFQDGYLYGTGDDLFFVFFCNDSVSGYGLYQYHFWLEDNENGSGKIPHLSYWNILEQTEADAVEVSFSTSPSNLVSSFKYCVLSFSSYSSLRIYPYDSYEEFLKHSSTLGCFTFNFKSKLLTQCFTTDLSSDFFAYDLWYGRNHNYKGSPSYHAQTCSSTSDDIGYICDGVPLSFTSYLDISKIGQGQIVTINGDTIYNYTITNPETGDSSKFGDYITNNYTYITNNNGGSSGGNVTVGGKIDVGGSVAVDVNVNVNGGVGDYTSLPDVDIANNLPEAPQGFIDYLTSLFSFLPASVLLLIIGGISAAIFCRVWGR